MPYMKNKKVEPKTFEEAIVKIIEKIEPIQISRETGCPTEEITEWTNPETTTLPSIDQAIMLDALYIKKQPSTIKDSPLLKLYKKTLKDLAQKF